MTTAADLAKRVGGSLTDARNLSSKLGTALEALGLLAAVLIACLLTLSSVSKRVREIGTLKALGWSRWTVVRQISGETLLQGLLGGVIGACGRDRRRRGDQRGRLDAASASVRPAPTAARPGPRAGPAASAWARPRAPPATGSELVRITTSVDPKLLLAAIVLAVLGGLMAGAVGGLRAARLSPAAALRTRSNSNHQPDRRRR